jgi:hypothetical protein
MAQAISETTQFEDIFGKPVVALFDSKLRSTDGGASLLGAIDRRIGLTAGLCAHLTDERDPARVEHTYEEMFRHRVYSIALGYPDCIDSARIGLDPVMKLLCGRGPGDRGGLASHRLSRASSTG